MLIELDGTANKSRLGANSILAVSIAIAQAAAKFIMFRYLVTLGVLIIAYLLQ